MFSLSHCCHGPFPLWESQSTSPPQDALQHCAGLWTCCGGSSDSNLVLLLCVLASKAHSYQNQCIFFCGNSQCPFVYSVDRACLECVDIFFSLYSWWEVLVLFLSQTTPGFQLWYYFHLCMWVVHWGLLLRVSCRTCVHPNDSQVCRWCSCLGRSGSGSSRYSGELASRAAGNIMPQKCMAMSIGQYSPAFFPGEPHL